MTETNSCCRNLRKGLIFGLLLVAEPLLSSTSSSDESIAVPTTEAADIEEQYFSAASSDETTMKNVDITPGMDAYCKIIEGPESECVVTPKGFPKCSGPLIEPCRDIPTCTADSMLTDTTCDDTDPCKFVNSLFEKKNPLVGNKVYMTVSDLQKCLDKTIITRANAMLILNNLITGIAESYSFTDLAKDTIEAAKNQENSCNFEVHPLQVDIMAELTEKFEDLRFDYDELEDQEEKVLYLKESIPAKPFYNMLMSLLNSLHDAHTFMLSPFDNFKVSFPLGLSSKLNDQGKQVVIVRQKDTKKLAALEDLYENVFKGSIFANNRNRHGEVVTKINGTDSLEFLLNLVRTHLIGSYQDELQRLNGYIFSVEHLFFPGGTVILPNFNYLDLTFEDVDKETGEIREVVERVNLIGQLVDFRKSMFNRKMPSLRSTVNLNDYLNTNSEYKKFMAFFEKHPEMQNMPEMWRLSNSVAGNGVTVANSFVNTSVKIEASQTQRNSASATGIDFETVVQFVTKSKKRDFKDYLRPGAEDDELFDELCGDGNEMASPRELSAVDEAETETEIEIEAQVQDQDQGQEQQAVQEPDQQSDTQSDQEQIPEEDIEEYIDSGSSKGGKSETGSLVGSDNEQEKEEPEPVREEQKILGEVLRFEAKYERDDVGFFMLETLSYGIVNDTIVVRVPTFSVNQKESDVNSVEQSRHFFPDFARVWAAAKDRGISRLLIDLSDNGGGFLMSAYALLWFLLNPELPDEQICAPVSLRMTEKWQSWFTSFVTGLNDTITMQHVKQRQRLGKEKFINEKFDELILIADFIFEALDIGEELATMHVDEVKSFINNRRRELLAIPDEKDRAAAFVEYLRSRDYMPRGFLFFSQIVDTYEDWTWFPFDIQNDPKTKLPFKPALRQYSDVRTYSWGQISAKGEFDFCNEIKDLLADVHETYDRTYWTDVAYLTDGTAGSAASLFTTSLHVSGKAVGFTYGSIYGLPMDTSSFAGGNVIEFDRYWMKLITAAWLGAWASLGQASWTKNHPNFWLDLPVVFPTRSAARFNHNMMFVPTLGENALPRQYYRIPPARSLPFWAHNTTTRYVIYEHIASLNWTDVRLNPQFPNNGFCKATAEKIARPKAVPETSTDRTRKHSVTAEVAQSYLQKKAAIANKMANMFII